jgi:hypothetical protein
LSRLFENGDEQGAGLGDTGALELRADGGQLLIHSVRPVDRGVLKRLARPAKYSKASVDIGVSCSRCRTVTLLPLQAAAISPAAIGSQCTMPVMRSSAFIQRS